MLALDLGGGAELRALEPWNADEFAAHVAQARDHLKPWIPFASRVVDAQTARDLLQRFADKQAHDEGRLYGIWIDGVLSGGTLFKTFDSVGGVCEIGVWLAPQAQGRGLISATARLMIDWAFRARGMHRVEWHTDPLNERSKAVAKRLGFTYEGTHRSDFVINGERHDSEVWSLLSSDPRA
ncbi:N-acetyltransferase [Rhizocola hellebori]|uniref:N-acetyltransferase n=1 Tax=Rhizocola hellebori TaxID=1392758 RepID=A0A8J3QIM0_9ACTN|nr:GNAT family protein [Rhizocola hellebori]GIH10429.1 N-acetyltransferase [Rhizocola hellebori]